MDTRSENTEFTSRLVKNLQMFFHNHMPYLHHIEIIGHIYLNVDSSKKHSYFLNEIISRTEKNGALFTSSSFHTEPPPPVSSRYMASSPDTESMLLPTVVNVHPDQNMSPNIQIQNVSSLAPRTPNKPMYSLNIPSLAPPRIQNISNLMPHSHGATIINKPPVIQSVTSLAPNINQPMTHDNIMTSVNDTNSSGNTPTPVTSASDLIKKIKNDINEKEKSFSENLPTSWRQKRKESHTARTEFPDYKTNSPPAKKKPRIIKPRGPKKKKLDVDTGTDNSQSSSEFVDLPVSFGEATTSDNNSDIFPISLLQNASGVPEAASSDLPVINTSTQNQKKDKCVLPKKKNTKKATRLGYNYYTQDERTKAVELASKFGITAVGEKFGIPNSTLWCWSRQYHAGLSKSSKQQVMETVTETDTIATGTTTTSNTKIVTIVTETIAPGTRATNTIATENIKPEIEMETLDNIKSELDETDIETIDNVKAEPDKTNIENNNKIKPEPDDKCSVRDDTKILIKLEKEAPF